MNCTTCIDTTDEPLRQAMRCGFLASIDAEQSRAWKHAEDDGPDYDVCPGYTSELPDVVDVAMSYAHWEKGQLHLALSGREPCRTLANGLAVLHHAVNASNMPSRKGTA